MFHCLQEQNGLINKSAKAIENSLISSNKLYNTSEISTLKKAFQFLNNLIQVKKVKCSF